MMQEVVEFQLVNELWQSIPDVWSTCMQKSPESVSWVSLIWDIYMNVGEVVSQI